MITRLIPRQCQPQKNHPEDGTDQLSHRTKSGSDDANTHQANLAPTLNRQWKNKDIRTPVHGPINDMIPMGESSSFWKSLAKEKRGQLDTARRQRLIRKLQRMPLHIITEHDR